MVIQSILFPYLGDPRHTFLHCLYQLQQILCMWFWRGQLQSWQKYLAKTGKLTQIGREQKTFLTFDHYCQKSLLEGRLGTKICPHIFPSFPKILSQKPLGNSWGHSSTKFIIIDIKSYFTFTCGESNLDQNTVKGKNILPYN